MFLSFIIYSVLISLMMFCAYVAAINEKKLRPIISDSKIGKLSFFKFEIIFPIFLFALVFGMRYDVGVDYLSYLEMYRYQDIPDKIEPLFRFLTIFCKGQGLHFSFYFGLIAFIQIYFFFYAFKDERYLFPFLVFALFMNGNWLFWMNGMRQSIALCIWLYSIKFISSKKLTKYFIWCIIAFLFHRSAIVLFLFYPILKNGRNYFKSVPLQLVLIGSAFGIRSIFNSISSNLTSLVNFYISILGKDTYESGYNINQLTQHFVEKQDGTGIAFIFRIIINLIIIFNSKKLKTFYNNPRFNTIYFFYFIGLIFSYLFPANLIAFTRPFRYFIFFDCIMLAYFLFYLARNRNIGINMALYRVIILLFILVFYLGLYVSDKYSHLWYQFYFQRY